MHARTPAALALATTLLTAGLSGCSDDSAPVATDAVATAKKNALAATSVAMKATGSVQGQSIALEADGTVNGSNQYQVQTAAKLKSEEYVLGSTAYFKANTEFLTANGMSATDAVKTADTWWSRSLGASQSTAAVDVKGLLTQFFASPAGTKLSSSSAKVTATRTSGQDTYTVTDSGAGGTSLVLTRGKNPHLVEIRGYASALTQDTKATYTFSRWNAVPRYTAPAGSTPLSEATSGSSSSSSPSSSPSASGSSTSSNTSTPATSTPTSSK